MHFEQKSNEEKEELNVHIVECIYHLGLPFLRVLAVNSNTTCRLNAIYNMSLLKEKLELCLKSNGSLKKMRSVCRLVQF